MTSLAVIPARAGSTRLKNKNFKDLGGIPLISHTINAVVDSGVFDEIVVSTDSPEIKKIAESHGLLVHNRPANHAGVKDTVLDAMIDFMKGFTRHDIFAYFLPTCPFRTGVHIKEAYDKWEINPYTEDACVSVTQIHEPPQLAMVKSHNHECIPVFDNLSAGITNSKYFKKYYKPNGGFYMAKWDWLLENKNFFAGTVYGYEMDKQSSLDINDELDFKFVELVYEQSRSN